jgi:hypothetical protein
VNAFHLFGGLLAVWALAVSFLGITRENFPRNDRAANLVMAVSAVLVALTIGSAIYTGATEDHEAGESHEPGAALRLL